MALFGLFRYGNFAFDHIIALCSQINPKLWCSYRCDMRDALLGLEFRFRFRFRLRFTFRFRLRLRWRLKFKLWLCVRACLLVDRFRLNLRIEKARRQPRAQGKFTCRLVELSKWTNVMSRTAALRWALSTVPSICEIRTHTLAAAVAATGTGTHTHTLAPQPLGAGKPVFSSASSPQRVRAAQPAVRRTGRTTARKLEGDLRSIGLAVFQRYAPKKSPTKKDGLTDWLSGRGEKRQSPSRLWGFEA